MIKAKDLKLKVKVLNKQINKEAIAVIDKHIDKYIDTLLAKQTDKRITGQNIVL
jgi:hypothetical protein